MCLYCDGGEQHQAPSKRSTKSSKPPFSPLCSPFMSELSPEHRDHPSVLRLFVQSDMVQDQEGATEIKGFFYIYARKIGMHQSK